MVFTKKKKVEEDEEIDERPVARREERHDRISKEIRGDYEEEYPEVDEEYEDEYERRPTKTRSPPKSPKGVSVVLSIDELRADYVAHMHMITQTNEALLRSGMPSAIASTTTQSVCAAHVARANEIARVLKERE